MTPEQKALLTIEKIASLDIFSNENEKNHALNDIYRIAHTFSTTCENPHPDWKEFCDTMAEKLKNY